MELFECREILARLLNGCLLPTISLKLGHHGVWTDNRPCPLCVPARCPDSETRVCHQEVRPRIAEAVLLRSENVKKSCALPTPTSAKAAKWQRRRKQTRWPHRTKPRATTWGVTRGDRPDTRCSSTVRPYWLQARRICSFLQSTEERAKFRRADRIRFRICVATPQQSRAYKTVRANAICPHRTTIGATAGRVQTAQTILGCKRASTSREPATT